MNEPRAKMDGNRLVAMGAPQADWTKTPGRLPGFWVAALGLIVAVVYPVPALIVGAVGLLFTLQAYRVIPAGVRGRGLTVAALVLAGATLALVTLQIVLTLLR